VLVNVPVARKPPIDSLDGVTEQIRTFEGELDGSGRILVRYSGTEPLLRVMIEGKDLQEIQHWAGSLAATVRSVS